ncbi:MAG TPA: cell division protein FtsL [Desulfuromonadales bacterium]|nr:cell division protein FtsL [Desulfuromonadales bacterium]
MAETTVKAIPYLGGFSLRRPHLLPVLVFIAVLFALSLFFVWSRIQVINLEYNISSLEEQLRTAQHQSRQLRLEAASLRSPARIEKIARQELGLQLPTPEQIVTVK